MRMVRSSDLVHMRPEQLGALDAWIADQPDSKPSRPEASRVALAEHLKVKDYVK